MALEVKKRYPIPRTAPAHHKLPQRTYRHERRKVTVKRTVMTFVILSVMCVGAGVAYTWYMGGQKTVLANQAPPVRKTRAIIKPPKVPSDARVGAAMQTYTPEVKPGENASATARSNPEATCDISVRYNNVAAVDSGLTSKVADEYGVVSWAWTVPSNAPTGTWPIDITCKNKKHSAVVSTEFIIKP